MTLLKKFGDASLHVLLYPAIHYSFWGMGLSAQTAKILSEMPPPDILNPEKRSSSDNWLIPMSPDRNSQEWLDLDAFLKSKEFKNDRNCAPDPDLLPDTGAIANYRRAIQRNPLQPKGKQPPASESIWEVLPPH
ncbi:MAG: hypothetical protein K9G62_07030 [Alphaproteobacteria bacterium]|nr:hypothetical protein [Alphaproteobacteria bacterium]